MAPIKRTIRKKKFGPPKEASAHTRTSTRAMEAKRATVDPKTMSIYPPTQPPKFSDVSRTNLRDSTTEFPSLAGKTNNATDDYGERTSGLTTPAKLVILDRFTEELMGADSMESDSGQKQKASGESPHKGANKKKQRFTSTSQVREFSTSLAQDGYASTNVVTKLHEQFD